MKKVVLIGDSIRMGYQQTVADQLADVAEVCWPEINGGDSRKALENIIDWVGARPADLVHINAGLHDLKRNRQTGAFQVPLQEYARNVEEILTAIGSATTGKIIWAATTPVNETCHHERKPFDRFEADVRAYNEAAADICRRHQVPVNDLYATLIDNGVESYLSPDGVHFNDAGYVLLGGKVAEVIRRSL